MIPLLKMLGKGLLLLLGFLLVWYLYLIPYGIRQGLGQFEVLWNSRPIEEVLNDPSFPDSLKVKLRLVQEIREFSVDSLGINDSENYTTVYDQKGKPILWVVSASRPFELHAYLWDYPLLGGLGYKGFFDQELAEKESNRLARLGYDTWISEVEAWSTLGFFQDPILTNNLNRSEGRLANLIIHELTHATLYVPGDGEYNENLATFIGDQGAYLFLEYKYGLDSPEYIRYKNEREDVKKWATHLLGGCAKLDSLYASFPKELSFPEKKEQKKEMITHILSSLDTLQLNYPERLKKKKKVKKRLPNNAFFVHYQMYRKDQARFEKEFREEFNSDFRRYLAYMKEKYPNV